MDWTKRVKITVEQDIFLAPYDEAKYIIIGSHDMFEGEDKKVNKVNEETRKFFLVKLIIILKLNLVILLIIILKKQFINKKLIKIIFV